MLWMLTGLSSAQAGELDVGVGLRNSLYEKNTVDGGRLLARWHAARWSVEGQLYATSETERIPELDLVLVTLVNSTAREDYTQTVGVDQLSGTALFSHRLVPPAGDLTCGPALYLGGEIGRQVVYTLSPDADRVRWSETGSRTLGGGVGGIGLELTALRFSARFSALERVRFIDGALDRAPTLALDVMWRL